MVWGYLADCQGVWVCVFLVVFLSLRFLTRHGASLRAAAAFFKTGGGPSSAPASALSVTLGGNGAFMGVG